MVIPVLFRMVGSGPSGSVPCASFSITASWAGLGLGKPSGRGNLNGVAVTPVTATERAKIVVEEMKCMMAVNRLAAAVREYLLRLGMK